MSNIYVGGISFDSGFSSGFKTTPLEISLVHFETLSPTVLNTSNELIDVISSNVEINSNDPSVIVTSNTLINVNQSNIEIVSNDIAVNVTSNASINVNQSNFDISLLSPDINIGISQNVSESLIETTSINIQDIIVSDNIIINTSETLIEITSIDIQDIIVSDNIIINVSESTIDITSIDIQDVIVSDNIIINVSESLIETTSIDIQDVIISDNITVNASETLIEVNPLTVNTNTTQNINTNISIIDITTNEHNVIVGIGVDVLTNDSNINLIINDAIASISKTVLVNESIIDISTNVVIAGAGTSFIVPNSIININDNDVSVNSDVNIPIDYNEITIHSNDVKVSISGTAFIDNPSTIDITVNTVSYEVGSEINVAEGIIEIRPITIDGAGEKIPDWEDCLNIDNPYWDKDSECRDNESNMHDNIINDMFNKFGVPGIWYQVDYSTQNEKVFGEDNDRTIERNFNVQYYTEQLPQDDKLWSKWGIEGMDNFHIYVAKSHFYEASQLNLSGNIASRPTTPKPGDIIMSTHNNVYYEIIEVKDKIDMFLQRSHTWDITIAPNIDKKYNVNINLINDDINNHINQEDTLGQNNLIDQEKGDVLYDDPNGNDPYGLF